MALSRADVFTAILALPDEPCMPRRARRYTYARDPHRDPWMIKRELGIAYAERCRQEWTNGDISCVVAVRRSPLRIVRRTGAQG